MRSFLWLSVLLLVPSLLAQPRGRIPPYLQPGRLDEEAGARVMERFRQIGIAGEFVFAVELIHQPYRGDSVTHEGRLAGGWTGFPRTRLDLEAPSGESTPRRFLQWNGPQPQTWSLVDGQLRQLQGNALHQPLIPGLTLTPYDVQMPFIYWTDYAYEGSSRLRGRGVHFFLLYPPEDDPRYASIGAVRVAIDADFNVAVRAETLDLDSQPLRRLDVQSVKKVQDQWIIRRLDLIDLQTRDRSRLEVVAARLSLQLPDKTLHPDGLDMPIPPVELEAL